MYPGPALALAITAAAWLSGVSSSGLSRGVISTNDHILDVSSALVADMTLFSQYSAATHCSAVDTGTVGTLITCASGNCPLVEAAGATLLGSFDE